MVTADPHLYDLTLQLLDADSAIVDSARSYAGMRSISLHGKRLLLNGEPVFQRLVLDQATTPRADDRAGGHRPGPRHRAGRAAGFNGARLHQKVFEERYLYHADRLGYLVWGEFGDWGCEVGVRDNQRPDASYVTEWLEALERDYSHPSIVGWCPLNETYQPLHDRITRLDDVTRAMFLATKQADGTRPVVDASGYAHRWQRRMCTTPTATSGPGRLRQGDGRPGGGPAVRERGARRPALVTAVPGAAVLLQRVRRHLVDPEAAAATGEERDSSWGTVNGLAPTKSSSTGSQG